MARLDAKPPARPCASRVVSSEKSVARELPPPVALDFYPLEAPEFLRIQSFFYSAG